jgi:NAD-dependent deacetylase
VTINEIDIVAGMVEKHRRLVVFTGAGISTESGLADFRSPGSIWEKFDADDFTYQKFIASAASRERYWQFSLSLWRQLSAARPNAGHLAIAELDRLGKLECVITQNIDNLHQTSGVPAAKIIALHGSAHWVSCMGCRSRFPAEIVYRRVAAGEDLPVCSTCGGALKPEVVFFGQPMPVRELKLAQRKAEQSRLFLVAGSSLVIAPAAALPLLAKKQGATLVIVNLSPTFQDVYADVVIRGRAGDILPQIVSLVKQKSR